MVVRSGTQWTQQALLEASNFGGNEFLGGSVVVSEDALRVGAPAEDRIATGVNGNQNDHTARNAGAAYLFSRSDGVWTQAAYLKASNTRLARGSVVSAIPSSATSSRCLAVPW